MRTRGIVGKRIAAVKQAFVWNSQTRTLEVVVEEIVLENGTRLIPIVSEMGDSYGVNFATVPKKRK